MKFAFFFLILKNLIYILKISSKTLKPGFEVESMVISDIKLFKVGLHARVFSF